MLGIGQAIGAVDTLLHEVEHEGIRDDISKTNQRVDALEAKLNDTIQSLPHIYTLRDDFLRIVSWLENKVDVILQRLPETKV